MMSRMITPECYKISLTKIFGLVMELIVYHFRLQRDKLIKLQYYPNRQFQPEYKKQILLSYNMTSYSRNLQNCHHLSRSNLLNTIKLCHGID